MDPLTDLPHEIRQHIFKDVDPLDLASLSLTCKEYHRFIAENRQLCKDLYLANLVSQAFGGLDIGTYGPKG